MENAARQGCAADRGGRGEGPATRSRAMLLAAGCLAAVALSGCAVDQRNTANDPLMGGRQNPPGSVAGGPGTAPPPPVASAPSAPAVPSSTAALASGARPLDGGMRIGGDTPRLPESSSNPSAPSAGWGAVLQNPEPSAGSMARSGPQPAPAGGPTYEQAQDILRGRGVTWQRLETWGDKGEWKFTCSIPNRQNPAIARNYEARAKAPIDAIHAVLAKLDKEP